MVKKMLIAVMMIVMLGSMIACDQSVPVDGVVRLHVIANSDSDEDQAVKLLVRDGILARFGDELAASPNMDACKKLVAQLLSEIQAEAESILTAQGMQYGAEAMLGVTAFPTRLYAGVTWDAGDYWALRIILGEGEGRNWWCVLYPPLCLVGVQPSNAKASGVDAVTRAAPPAKSAASSVKMKKDTKSSKSKNRGKLVVRSWIWTKLTDILNKK